MISYGDLFNCEVRYNDFIDWAHVGVSLTEIVDHPATMTGNKIHHNYITTPSLGYGRGLGNSSLYGGVTGHE